MAPRQRRGNDKPEQNTDDEINETASRRSAVVAIEHRNGVNCYAAWSRDALLAQLTDYCRMFGTTRRAWKTTATPETLSDQGAINLYFEDHDSESYTLHECELETGYRDKGELPWSVRQSGTLLWRVKNR